MIKILYLKTGMHDKNHHSIMNYKKIILYIINDVNLLDTLDLTTFDCIYSPLVAINVKKYPNNKFIFGPHFSVFPVSHQLHLIKGERTIYIQPSSWVVNLWKNNPVCDEIKICDIPFGIDTDKYKNITPICQRDQVFVYFKFRHPYLLHTIETFLKSKNIQYEIFNYTTKYDEQTYINKLRNSKYGVWVGRHESQGFALEEALSMDVPLFVWNVKSMNEEYEEYESIYKDIIPTLATTIPYWSEMCGEYFYHANDIENTFELFMSKLNTYKPREYILNNLSMECCENKFIEMCKRLVLC